jgi:hypothetical protein
VAETCNPLRTAYRRWLECWWREHHPAGGGTPPTLEEAFAAGAVVTSQANADKLRQPRRDCEHDPTD